MDPILAQFAEEADSKSVNRLIALSEFTKSIPAEKMAKTKSLELLWGEVDGEILPRLKMEFYE
jgi:hypothetical protein